MRRKEPTINHRALDQIGEGKIASVLDSEGKALVQGLFARRRGRKLLWLFRYRTKDGVQRELTLGHMCPEGIQGTLAASAGYLGPKMDFQAELVAASAKSAIPAGMIDEVARRVRAILDSGFDPVVERQNQAVVARRDAAGHGLEMYAKSFLELGVKRRGKPLRPGTKREYERALMVHAAPLHGHDVREITTRDISDLIEHLAKERGRICAARTRAALSRLFGWMASKGILDRGNPVTPVQTYANDPRDRVLTDDELRQIWAWCIASDSDYARIIRLILWTGLRRSEAGGVSTAELMLDGGLLLRRERAKNGRELLLPMPRQAQAAIALWASEGFLFGRTDGRPFSGWSAAKRRLDAAVPVAPWSLHDLRRTTETETRRAWRSAGAHQQSHEPRGGTDHHDVQQVRLCRGEGGGASAVGRRAGSDRG